MKKILIPLLGLALLASPALPAAQPAASNQTQNAALNWTTNYDQALKDSKATGKPVVLFFTGSDWCGWCHKLEDEVLSNESFVKSLGKEYIFVKLDYPINTKLDSATEAQNKRLQAKYQIKGYPHIIVIDGDENILFTGGYAKGGGAKYASSMKKQIDQKIAENTSKKPSNVRG